MPIFFQGKTVTLSANGSDSIRIRIEVDGEIIQFLVNSTGRVKITDMELTGYKDFFDGSMELHQFKKDGNVYPLPEPIPCTRGSDFVVSLTDISGSSNVVYFALAIKTR